MGTCIGSLKRLKTLSLHYKKRTINQPHHLKKFSCNDSPELFDEKVTEKINYASFGLIYLL